MFFIGIFGIEDKKKEIKTIRNISCKNCDGISGLTLFKVYSYFHMFFLRLFRWNERYYLACNRCNSIYEISKEKGARAEKGEEEAITYWDLKSIDYGYYNNHIQHKCKNCGKEIEARFEYCPFCGKRRE